MKPMFKDDFVVFMDQKFAATPVIRRDPQVVIAQWNADIRSEFSRIADQDF